MRVSVCLTPALPGPWQHIKQFLLLSKWPQALASRYLKETETKKPNNMPDLFISRHLALKHRENPGLDPSCRNAIFTQVPLPRASSAGPGDSSHCPRRMDRVL